MPSWNLKLPAASNRLPSDCSVRRTPSTRVAGRRLGAGARREDGLFDRLLDARRKHDADEREALAILLELALCDAAASAF